MEYDKNGQILREFYARHDLTDCFERVNTYLESAFDEINRIWFDNLYKIDEVNYLMIAEAPLWGKSKSYIYNPATPFTQFFQKSDLEYVLGTKIRDKAEFIDRCNQIGLLIIDISPFALNTEDTTINYRRKSKLNPYGITKREYRLLIQETLPTFFDCKIEKIAPKASCDIRVFFRYARVENTFRDIIADSLIKYNLLASANDLPEISNPAGGIDRNKIKTIINLAVIYIFTYFVEM